MEKIEETLNNQINTKPKDSFNVILCTSIDHAFTNKKWNKLMEGIFAANLTGEEIKKLAAHNDVLSIESDLEIGIL